MRVLVVSNELIGASLCHQLIKEGHEVKLYIGKDNWNQCLENIVPKTNSWKDELEWVGTEGLIIFDDVGFGKEQDQLRIWGYKVVGGSLGGDKLELDREFFQRKLSSLGIPTLPSFDFPNPLKAIEYIKRNPGQWVAKQNAHVGMLNFVGTHPDGKDTILALESLYDAGVSSVHLQKYVDGVEIGVARYFNGEDWVGPIEVNHEHKRLCNGDVGPLTHEMGTVIWYSDDEQIPVFQKTLAKLKPYLKSVDFRGDIDINCIVKDDCIFPLEATPRFGNPSTPIQCELHRSPWGEFLYAIASKEPYDLSYKKTFGIGVCIALPPFPNLPLIRPEFFDRPRNIPLFFDDNFTEDDARHLHLEEISLTEKNGHDQYHWSGMDGWTMHVTGEGARLTEAQEKVYSLINKITLPNMFYRTDIGDRVKNNDLDRLKEWAWI